MATAAAASSRTVAEADHAQESGATHAAAAAKRLHAKVKGKTKHHRGKHDHHRRGTGHAHDPAHPLSHPERSALLARTGIQPALLISQPGDAAEAEADRVADRVVAMKDPPAVPARTRGGDLQRSPLVVQRAAARAPAPPTPQPAAENVADAATEAAVKAELSGGAPMAADVAGFFGRRFGANFGDVRIHTDDKAANLATRLGARAFTYGRHVFFNGGQYNPDSEDGTKLIAHELAHTIQQSAVIQLKEDSAAPPRVTSRSAPMAQRGIVSRALNWIADKANYIPGFRLFTIVIGVNPINMSTVERSGANILRALIEFIPGGVLIVDALNNHGIFEKGGKFIEDQFHSLGMVGAAFRDALMEFIDSLSWSDVFHLGDVWDRAKRIFTAPVDKLISFGKGLVVGIAEIVKDAILKPLGRYAAGIIPKFDMLAGVFGKNPVSGESVSPANALIGGFMTLIGQEELWANIQKSGAVGKAWNWFKGALSGALALVRTIPDRFISTLKSLTIFDIVTIVGAWVKFGKLFLGFVADFAGWALKQVLKLLEIILEVVAPSVIPYLKKAGAAFNTIIKAPGQFIGYLVKAGKAGFNMFKTNILAHLQRGILDWLLGSLAGANLYIPKSFALPELLKFGLSVVGATWENVRAKLVAATSETAVKVLETTFDLVKTLVTKGPAAAWEQLLESLSNLKSMVMDAIIDYVKGKVIEIAIEKVLSFLNPAGAFIQALLAIYRTITFIVGKLQQIGAVVAALIDGIAAIAAGNIGPASAKVESVLAKGLSLAINFLANFAGLGNVSKKVIEIINKIRKPVDAALDKLVTWIVNKAKALFSRLFDKKEPDSRAEEQRRKDKLAGIKEAEGLVDPDNFDEKVIRTKLLSIKSKYKLLTLNLVVDSKDKTSETIHFSATASAEERGGAKKVTLAPPSVVQLAEGAWIQNAKGDYEQVTGNGNVRKKAADGKFVATNFLTTGGNYAYADEGTAWKRTPFVHPSKLVVPMGGGKFQLKPERDRDYIRTQFYKDSDNSRKKIVKSKVGALLNPADPSEFLSQGDPAAEASWGYTKKDPASGKALVPVKVASPDHFPPIAQHWNGPGSKNSQAFREAWNLNPGTFRIMSLALNISLGSGNVKYSQDVGISFRGPGE